MKKTTIPSNWNWATLDDISTNIVDGPFGSNLKTVDYVPEGTVPVLQGKNITDNKFDWFDIRFITEEKAESLKRSKAFEGDHLLIKIGSIGYSAILDNLHGYPFAIIPANLAKISPDRNKVDDRYLHRWLTSVDSTRHFQHVASKTAQPALSLKKIKASPIPLPPLDEQRRIAEILDQAGALRQKRRRALARLDDLLQSVFLEMFGDPVTNPKGWDIVPFEKLAAQTRYSLKRGPFGGALKKEIFVENGYWVYEQQHAIYGDFSSGRYFITKKKYQEMSPFKVEPGDFIISCSGTVGKISRLPLDAPAGVINQALLKISLNEKLINPIYFQALYESDAVQRELFGVIRGTGIKNFPPMKIVREFPMILPPIEFQKEFDTRVKTIKEIVSNCESSLEKLDALFGSLQARAFRGEV